MVYPTLVRQRVLVGASKRVRVSYGQPVEFRIPFCTIGILFYVEFYSERACTRCDSKIRPVEPQAKLQIERNRMSYSFAPVIGVRIKRNKITKSFYDRHSRRKDLTKANNQIELKTYQRFIRHESPTITPSESGFLTAERLS